MKKEALTLGLLHIRDAARAKNASYRNQLAAERLYRQIYSLHGATQNHIEMCNRVNIENKFYFAMGFDLDRPPDRIEIVGGRR